MKNAFLITAIFLCVSASATWGQASGGRQAHAATQQEADDYGAAFAARGGAAMEKAADDFAAAYPSSELTASLYTSAMRAYQEEDNATRVLMMGEKALALDPDNPVALVILAYVMADNLNQGERGRKADDIKKHANRALQTMDVAYVAPAGASADQVAAYKTALRSMAYSALGIMKLKTGDDNGAEKDLKAAADLNRVKPDPYIWYHLALAQDHRKQYSAALHSVEQAMQLASSIPELQRLAEMEHDRLLGLTGKGPRTPAAAGTQPQ
jgi:tetratricopeptide (TPR) repeat protein